MSLEFHAPSFSARALPATDDLIDAAAEGRWAEALIAGLGTAIAVTLISLVSVLVVIF